MSNPPPIPKAGDSPRLFWLDVVRGIAVLLVLFHHFPPAVARTDGFVECLVRHVAEIGWVGVDLFFVLSGFLISCLIYREYDRTGRFRPLRFLLRRGFKIWPAYFAAFGTMTVLRWAVAGWRGQTSTQQQLLSDAWWNSIFLQNYVACERWQHSWSLAVEEHFYLVFAVAVFGLTAPFPGRWAAGKWRFGAILPAFLVAAVLALALRGQAVYPGHDWHTAYYRTHLRADSLLFGALVGYTYWYHRARVVWLGRSPWLVAVAAAMAIAVPTLWPLGEDPRCCTLGFTILYVAFGLIVLAAGLAGQPGGDGPQRMRALARLLAWTGGYSYTIYLAHSVLFGIPGVERFRQTALGALKPLVGDGTAVWLDRFVFVAVSVGLGVLLSLTVERPFLRLRQRWYPSDERRRCRRFSADDLRDASDAVPAGVASGAERQASIDSSTRGALGLRP